MLLNVYLPFHLEIIVNVYLKNIPVLYILLKNSRIIQNTSLDATLNRPPSISIYKYIPSISDPDSSGLFNNLH